MGANGSPAETARIQLRRALPSDVEFCARVLYDASADAAQRNGIRQDYATIEVARKRAEYVVNEARIYGLVADSGNQVVGCAFLHEFNEVRGVGPVGISPSAQGRGVAKLLMLSLLRRAGNRDADVRLIMNSYSVPAMGLYLSLGFFVREQLMWMAGNPTTPPGETTLFDLEAGDLEGCRRLCVATYGFDRTEELKLAAGEITGVALKIDGSIVAFASRPRLGPEAFCVARADEHLIALVGAIAKSTQTEVSVLIPVSNDAVLKWALRTGFRVVKPMTLMSLNNYRAPLTAYLPSVQY